MDSATGLFHFVALKEALLITLGRGMSDSIVLKFCGLGFKRVNGES